MYLFDKLTIVEDTAYRGGGRRSSAAITTGRRALPERTSKDTTPTLHIRLSAQALEQLRNNDPIQFGLLVDLVNKLTRKDAAEIRMSSAEVDALRRGDKEAARRLVGALPPNPAAPAIPPPAAQTPARNLIQDPEDQPIGVRLRARRIAERAAR